MLKQYFPSFGPLIEHNFTKIVVFVEKIISRSFFAQIYPVIQFIKQLATKNEEGSVTNTSGALRAPIRALTPPRIPSTQLNTLKYVTRCLKPCCRNHETAGFHCEHLDDKHFYDTTFLFLDASTHLYKRVCPSVRRSVSPSVRP